MDRLPICGNVDLWTGGLGHTFGASAPTNTVLLPPSSPRPPTTLAELVGLPLHAINVTLPAEPSNETLAFCASHDSPLERRRLLFAAAMRRQPYLCSSSLPAIGAWVDTLGTPTEDSPVYIDRQVERPSTIASITHLGRTLAVGHLKATAPPTYACHYHKPDEHDELYNLTAADGSVSYAICHEHDKMAPAGLSNSSAVFNPDVTSQPSAVLSLAGCAAGLRFPGQLSCDLRTTGDLSVTSGCLATSQIQKCLTDVVRRSEGRAFLNLGGAGPARSAPRGMHCHPLKLGDLVYLDSAFASGY